MVKQWPVTCDLQKKSAAFCLKRPCYYGQPVLIHWLILRILTGESPEETRKLVAHEQIVEHWPKFTASEGANSEFLSTSESLKGRVTYQNQCVRNARVGVRAWGCMKMSETHAQCVRLESSVWVAEKIGTELACFPVSDTSGTEQNLQVFPADGRRAYVFVGVLPGFNILLRRKRDRRSLPVVALASIRANFSCAMIGLPFKGVSGGGMAWTMVSVQALFFLRPFPRARLALASFSPIFALNAQIITPVLQARLPMQYSTGYFI